MLAERRTSDAERELWDDLVAPAQALGRSARTRAWAALPPSPAGHARTTLVLLGIALLLVVLAVPLVRRRVAPNRTYGIRVPATLADEQVWYDANAAGGRDLLVFAGVLVVAAFVLPSSGDASLLAAAVLLVVGALAVAGVGWRWANRMLAERRADQP